VYVVQLNEELLHTLNTDESTNGFSITSAPVILYLSSAHCDINTDKLAVFDDKQLKMVSDLLSSAAATDWCDCWFHLEFLFIYKDILSNKLK